MELQKKKIINKFLCEGYLITRDLLESVDQPESLNSLFEHLKNSDKKKEALVLNRAIKNITDASKTINWGDYDNVVLVSQKRKDPCISLRFLESGEKEDAAIKSTKTDWGVKVVFSYDKAPTKRGAQDFAAHFNERYSVLSGFLKQRTELGGVISINRITHKKDREQVSIIGMVFNKETRESGNIFFDVEDPTGAIKVLVNRNRPDLIEIAKDTSFDEVVGIKGVSGGNIFFANNIISQGIPYKELKKSQKEEQAVFLSDLHVGSRLFLGEAMDKFLNWLNGRTGSEEQRKIASQVKYIVICGDLVAGVGIYPSQQEDLEIPDIHAQYKKCAEILSQFPSHIPIIICAGNHDAVRLAEPQPVINKKFIEPLLALPNIILVSNPAVVNIGAREDFSGFNVLLYHGYSFVHYADNTESIRTKGGVDKPDFIMKHLLEKRHLAPAHASTQYIPDPEMDPLIIHTIPDFFVAGHIHKASVAMHKNITLVCGSCWESKTPFEEKMGLNPEPGRVPIINLKTRKAKILRFYD